MNGQVGLRMRNETKFSVNPRVADICHCRPSWHEAFLLVGDTSLLCGFLERDRTQMLTTKPRMATNTLHSLLLVCLANKTLASSLGIFRERCSLHSPLETRCDRMSWTPLALGGGGWPDDTLPGLGLVCVPRMPGFPFTIF